MVNPMLMLSSDLRFTFELYFMRELSVVITVMNEEENINPLLESVHSALDEIDYEIVLVDDGSTDRTKQQVLKWADERTVFIELRKNYGQSTAMAAGIDYSTGRYIALLDGDMQNDPYDIPGMLNMLKREDWDVVAGNRKNRKDGFFLRKIPSKIANTLIRQMTGIPIKDYGCTLKVFRREIAEKLNLYGELHRFIPVLAKMQGAKITQVDVKHHPGSLEKVNMVSTARSEFCRILS
jgi:glycosyltransferase involved in cell wall biosynthesis